ncbi:hypothetical protein [Serratia marcescens]|uniref:hypothetical protein n=1 Tax=Serratia marcescens TaxID=615 RepID=UPI001F15602A|nr:hypothetical protein [Serratia marcescens]
MDKLSELSKPIQIFKHPAGRNFWAVSADSNAGARDVEPFYSQEYVSALQHESAVNWEAAASLNVENQELKKRIAELERARFIAWPGAMFAPVLARIKVDVKHRDGSLSVGKSAGNVVWYHSDSPSDVVAFALAVEGDEQ